MLLDDVSSAARDEIPGREKEVKKSAEEKLARAGNTVDHTVQEGELTPQLSTFSSNTTDIQKASSVSKPVSSTSMSRRRGLSTRFSARSTRRTVR